MTYLPVLGIIFMAVGAAIGYITYFTGLQLPQWIRTKSGPDTHTRYAVRHEDGAGNTFWQPRTEDERHCLHAYTHKLIWVPNHRLEYVNHDPALYSSHRRAERIGRRREARIAYENTLTVNETPGAKG